ncbi:MAG: SUMF1/EgtB/PvdO family nonheme iron enzyme [Synechococcales cyanobacterium M58_A2018_015]|nr:SUMF1/EgtB/PvdO family nonheme iron enzyme [Synechococcales cyanobacterium M58_A2018_015]
MLIGQILRGRYEILEQLGEGAFGETYKARDLDKPSQPFCVVKRLKPAHTHQRVRDFFNKEAAVLEKLGEHPQIPQLLAHFMIDTDLFIVQQFIQGHSLRQEITPGTRLSESYVTQFLQDILEILVNVHQNGVIHRDIKPENVMRRQQDGKLVLIDFGVVKELGSIVVNSQGSIQTSVVAGTRGYMPIEQFNGKPGFYSDVYAVGKMAIEALTGIHPVHLPDDPQTGEVQWRNRAQVSDRLAAVIDKMVRNVYQQRYRSAIEALQALQPIIHPLPASGTVPIPRPTPTSASPPPLIISPSPAPSASPLSSASPHVSPAASASPPSNWTRRKLIKGVGWASAGMGAVALVALGQRLLSRDRAGDGVPPPSAPSPPPALQSFQFETVTVNERGEEIDRRSGQAQFFAEDLGNGITLEMVEIPGGTFTMGSPADEPRREEDESPQHEVTVPRFFMGKFPVTQAQYEAMMGLNPALFQGANRPVETVSWNEAVEFCEKLSQQTGRTYRLPSEAEWEYACRAGTQTPFYFGETLTGELANYTATSTYASEPQGEYRNQTTEVGIFPPNAFGLYDMHGNVWEWCLDHWHNSYEGAPGDGSAWLDDKGDLRVLRGGSWFVRPWFCRSADRLQSDPVVRIFDLGFRVVCVDTKE